MSCGATAAAWVAAAAVAAGTAASAYETNRQRKAQKKAAEQQEAAAKKQLAAEDEAQNRANRKQADIEGLLSADDTSGALGSGATSLTGASGAAIDQNLLGKAGTLGS